MFHINHFEITYLQTFLKKEMMNKENLSPYVSTEKKINNVDSYEKVHYHFSGFLYIATNILVL